MYRKNWNVSYFMRLLSGRKHCTMLWVAEVSGIGQFRWWYSGGHRGNDLFRSFREWSHELLSYHLMQFLTYLPPSIMNKRNAYSPPKWTSFVTVFQAPLHCTTQKILCAVVRTSRMKEENWATVSTQVNRSQSPSHKSILDGELAVI